MKEFREGLNCGRKGWFLKNDIREEYNGYNYEIKKAMSKLLQDEDLMILTEDDIEKKVEIYFKQEVEFRDSSQEKYYVNKYKNALMELRDMLISKKLKISKISKHGQVNFCGVDVYVSFDFALTSRTGKNTFVKLLMSDVPVSQKARNVDKKPENDVFLQAGLKLIRETGDALTDVGYLSLKTAKMVSLSYRDETSKYITDAINSEHSISNFNKDKCKNCDYENICNYNEKFVSRDYKEPEKEEIVHRIYNSVKLTPMQECLKDFDSGVLRVNAVAGSGKTTVLALRTVELLKKGVEPKDIMLITFTNEAKKEILEKTVYWAEEEGITVDISELKINTFNNLGFQIIKENYGKLGFIGEPQLLSRSQEFSIIEEILKEVYIPSLNYGNPYLNFPYAKGSVIEMSQKIKDIQQFNVENFMDYSVAFGVDEESAKLIIEVYRRFVAEKKKRNFIDYQDQIILLNDYLKKDEEYCVEHLMVDEFQDSDQSQLDFIRELYLRGLDSLVIVGDDMQSIYGFRNVDSKNLLNFHKLFTETIDINLEENFRTTQEIAEEANRIIDSAGGMKKRIIAKKKGGFVRKSGLIKDIPALVLDIISQTDSKKEVAIISRTRSELINISRLLDEKGIKYEETYKERYLDNVAVQNVIAYAKFYKTLELKFGILGYLNLIGEDLTEKNIEDYSLKMARDFVELKSEEEKVEFFINSLKDMKDNYVIKNFLSLFTKDNFDDFIDQMIKFALYGDDSEIRYSKDPAKIKLITAHASKGKEFDVVINITSKYDVNDEDKRLLYVSVTRAKEQLYMISDKRIA